MTPLFKKLNRGASEKVLVLNAPESFATELAQLEGVEVIRKATPKAEVPFAIGFAATQRECDLISSMAANATEFDAIVWIAYPKAASN
ncbi:hypothetical protein [Algiphilus sp.]|uniref:hypothetical protein n=1 Tax=Algiphilus sp. TaxID=1872431 RepID=UPI0032EB4637